MTNIKIGIVEDEAIIADNLCNILKNLGYKVAEPASSYSEAINMIETEKPDLLLLDIHLAGNKDGIELAHTINEKYGIPFIFLTANADAATVQKAKLAEPPAFLVKPFNNEDLYASIEVCLHNFSRNNRLDKSDSKPILRDSIFIKETNYFHKVRFSDILFLESDHVYVIVHTILKKIMVRTALHEFKENFDENKFFRIHRSYVINIDHIESVNAENVYINSVCLPVGKTYRAELFSRLSLR